MRAIEDMAGLVPRMSERVRLLQYTHEILIRALDEAEERECQHP